jgi:hypothetical protein
MRWLLRAVLGVAALTVLAALAYFFAPAIGSWSTKDLGYSVSRGVGGDILEPGTCERTKRHRHEYHCRVTVGGSGGATYDVTIKGRCWDARVIPRFGVEGDLDRRHHACIKLRDQLRLVQRVLG